MLNINQHSEKQQDKNQAPIPSSSLTWLMGLIYSWWS